MFPTPLGRKLLVLHSWKHRLETLEGWKRRGFRFRIKCVRGKFYLTAYRKVNGKFLEKSLGRISSEQLAILREGGYVKTSNSSKASKSNCKTCSNNDLSNSTNTTTQAPKNSESKAHGDEGVGGWGFMALLLRA